MLNHEEDDKKVPLLRERGKSGKVVLTNTFLLRAKKTPKDYRDNSLKLELIS